MLVGVVVVMGSVVEFCVFWLVEFWGLGLKACFEMYENGGI